MPAEFKGSQRRPSRRAFTLLEVLISVLLLFMMGAALLSLDNWIAKKSARDQADARLLHAVSPLLFQPPFALNTRLCLYDTLRFRRLRDDEVFWLKRLCFEARAGMPHRETLYDDEKNAPGFYYRSVILRSDTSHLRFLRMEP